MLIWSQLGGDTCHRMIGLREGQDGVNKGGLRLINAHEFFGLEIVDFGILEIS